MHRRGRGPPPRACRKQEVIAANPTLSWSYFFHQLEFKAFTFYAFVTAVLVHSSVVSTIEYIFPDSHLKRVLAYWGAALTSIVLGIIFFLIVRWYKIDKLSQEAHQEHNPASGMPHPNFMQPNLGHERGFGDAYHPYPHTNDPPATQLHDNHPFSMGDGDKQQFLRGIGIEEMFKKQMVVNPMELIEETSSPTNASSTRNTAPINEQSSPMQPLSANPYDNRVHHPLHHTHRHLQPQTQHLHHQHQHPHHLSSNNNFIRRRKSKNKHHHRKSSRRGTSMTPPQQAQVPNRQPRKPIGAWTRSNLLGTRTFKAAPQTPVITKDHQTTPKLSQSDTTHRSNTGTLEEIVTV